jgi:hypothetical protein
MLKNKRIKKNWSEEDVLILIWVLSKYFDKMGYRDLEKDMVCSPPRRITRIGCSSRRSSPE